MLVWQKNRHKEKPKHTNVVIQTGTHTHTRKHAASNSCMHLKLLTCYSKRKKKVPKQQSYLKGHKRVKWWWRKAACYRCCCSSHSRKDDMKAQLFLTLHSPSPWDREPKTSCKLVPISSCHFLQQWSFKLKSGFRILYMHVLFIYYTYFIDIFTHILNSYIDIHLKSYCCEVLLYFQQEKKREETSSPLGLSRLLSYEFPSLFHTHLSSTVSLDEMFS